MSTRKETYENCEIKIKDEKWLYINQKEIEYLHDEEQGKSKWSSKHLPYTQYDSLDDLAKAIVTDTAEFKE